MAVSRMCLRGYEGAVPATFRAKLMPACLDLKILPRILEYLSLCFLILRRFEGLLKLTFVLWGFSFLWREIVYVFFVSRVLKKYS